MAFLDDDTLLPDDYDSTILKAINDHPKAQGFIFQQWNNNSQARMIVSCDPLGSFVENADGCNKGDRGCDTGQMLFQRRLIDEIKWRDMQAADHEFYQDVVTRRLEASTMFRGRSVLNARR